MNLSCRTKLWKNCGFVMFEQHESRELPEQVVATLGYSRCCIYDWLAAYREGANICWRAVRLTMCGKFHRWIGDIHNCAAVAGSVHFNFDSMHGVA